MSLTPASSAEWRFALMILAPDSPPFGKAIMGGTVDRAGAAIDLWAVGETGHGEE